LSRRRQRALADCGTDAATSAIYAARPASLVRAFIVTGCSAAGLDDSSRRAHGSMLLVGAALLELRTLGRSQRVGKWLDMAATRDSSSWPDRDRCLIDLLRGTVNWMAGDIDAGLDYLTQASASAMRLKDPTLVALTGWQMCTVSHFFHRFDKVHEVCRLLYRLSEAERVPSIEALALTIDGCCRAEVADYAAARERLAALRAHSVALPTVQTLWARLHELVCRLEMSEDANSLAPDVLEHLHASERGDLFFIPAISFAALALALAAGIDADLDPAPPGWRAALQRARRRFRPLGARGRWRRPQWLAARGLYDARTGRPERGARLVGAALDGLAKAPLPYSTRLITLLAHRVFASDSDIHARCQAASAALASAAAPAAPLRAPPAARG
jgi:hypothetical protein